MACHFGDNRYHGDARAWCVGNLGPISAMPGPSNAWTIGLVEGTVKSVDPATGTVQISTGLLGLFGKTLRLSEDTEVQIDGRLGSLTEIREGARVKVAYEVRDGKNVATHIELTPRV